MDPFAQWCAVANALGSQLKDGFDTREKVQRGLVDQGHAPG
jgi:hypothetical protein